MRVFVISVHKVAPSRLLNFLFVDVYLLLPISASFMEKMFCFVIEVFRVVVGFFCFLCFFQIVFYEFPIAFFGMFFRRAYVQAFTDKYNCVFLFFSWVHLIFPRMFLLATCQNLHRLLCCTMDSHRYRIYTSCFPHIFWHNIQCY